MTSNTRISRIIVCLLVTGFFAVLLVQGYRKPTLAADVILIIDGEVPTPRQLTATDLAKLPRRAVEVKDQTGAVIKYEGFRLFEVLQLAGVTFGTGLSGERLATYLLTTGADNYKVVFALPEFDPAFTNKEFIIADSRDGKPLSAQEGPLRIIVPDEKRQARWVKQIKHLTIQRATPV